MLPISQKSNNDFNTLRLSSDTVLTSQLQRKIPISSLMYDSSIARVCNQILTLTLHLNQKIPVPAQNWHPSLPSQTFASVLTPTFFYSCTLTAGIFYVSVVLFPALVTGDSRSSLGTPIGSQVTCVLRFPALVIA